MLYRRCIPGDAQWLCVAYVSEAAALSVLSNALATPIALCLTVVVAVELSAVTPARPFFFADAEGVDITLSPMRRRESMSNDHPRWRWRGTVERRLRTSSARSDLAVLPLVDVEQNATSYCKMRGRGGQS
jgi:hypothetical protein